MSPRSAPASAVACETHCPYCALQCGMNLVPIGGRTTVVKRDFPTNRGGLCQKGWTAAELLEKGGVATREDIRVFMSGNYCRCTGYHAIVDAIETTMKTRAGA